MADNPLILNYLGNFTPYAILRRDADSQVYNGSGFEIWSNAHIGTYSIVLTNNGGGTYSASCPTVLLSGTSYSVGFYESITGTASATGDLRLSGYQFFSGNSGSSSNTGPWLTTINAVKDLLGISHSVSTYDAKLTIAMTGATSAIISYCNRDFFLTDYTEYQDGSAVGLNYGFLETDNSPVVSLTSVTYDPESVNSTTYSGSNFIYDDATGFIRWNPDATNATVFVAGFRRLKIIYTAGYSTIPTDLDAACASVAAIMYQSMTRDPTLTGERIGDYSYRSGSPLGNPAAKPVSFLDNIKPILVKYKRVGAL